MKRLCRYAFPLMLAVIMATAMSQAVLAETVKGEVTYTGNELDLEYSTEDISAQLAKLTPGDEVDLQFKLVNDSDDKTDWYVEDDVIKAFEDSSSAENGAYTYKLSYTSSAGKTTEIYSSDVGGNNADTTVPKGLHQASSGSEEYFYLDRIGAGGTGTVTLSIAIDGESLRNDYQSTLADLKVSFAVEVPEDTDAIATTSKGANTGDTTHLATYITLFVIAALLLAATLVYAKRAKEKGGSDEK